MVASRGIFPKCPQLFPTDASPENFLPYSLEDASHLLPAWPQFSINRSQTYYRRQNTRTLRKSHVVMNFDASARSLQKNGDLCTILTYVIRMTVVYCDTHRNLSKAAFAGFKRFIAHSCLKRSSHEQGDRSSCVFLVWLMLDTSWSDHPACVTHTITNSRLIAWY
jgi:hypothetical protein